MTIVFGMEIPVFEFLLILNIIMLVYIVISMFEIRSLIQLRKDLEELIGKPVKKREDNLPITEVKIEEKKTELKA